MATLSYLRGIVLLCSFLILSCSNIAESTYPETDKINVLPGQPPVNFSQYSGYIKVDDAKNVSLFYYLVEAETDPSSKPLFIWLSGGPGGSTICSSAFGGHGPFSVKENFLVRNEHSMNKVANMLYVESPAGVGFSYFPNQSYITSLDDESVAQNDLVFLQRWLEKFAVYKNRELYIGGQSYAGHFVPNLAKLIIETNLKSNLKGIMLVSPLLDFYTDYSNEHKAMYLWTHGMISDSTYDFILKSPCNMSQYEAESYKDPIIPTMSPLCRKIHDRAQQEFRVRMYDRYDVTSDKCPDNMPNYATWSIQTPENKELCASVLLSFYVRRPDVIEAFHAHFHSDAINYDIFNNYSTESFFKSMIPTLNVIVQSGISVLVASGDQDSVVPFISTRSILGTLAEDMGLMTSLPYMPWFKNLDQGQIGGWIQSYGQGNLTYLTVKDAAHFVHGQHAGELVMLFEAWRNNKFPVKP